MPTDARAPFGLRALLAASMILGLTSCGAARPISTHTVRAVRHAIRRRVPLLRLPVPLPARVVRVPILMYHRIDRLTLRLPPITRALTVTPAEFGAQLAWLAAHGFHPIAPLQLFDGLMRGAPLPHRPVVITFDDGYRDVLGKAAPALRRFHMPAVAFVITGRISGPDPSFLTWGELRLLERSGVAIGSHTVAHRPLTGLGSRQALAELRGSRAALERRLGHPVQWLAYPAGAEDARVVVLAREAGYVLGLTTRPGVDQRASDPLELRRYEILDTTGVTGLASLLSREAGPG